MISCTVQKPERRFGGGTRTSWRNGNTKKEAGNSKQLSKRNYSSSNKNYKTTKKLSTKDYVNLYAEIAVHEMNYSGIPASITLAQGILESGNGNSSLARKSNNHFGIKCHKSWEGERVYHDDDRPNECFRKYDNPEDSYKDHTDFLMRNARYQPLFNYGVHEYEEWAKGLKKAGYATAPDYAEKLISLIDRYELYQYSNNYVSKHRRPVITQHTKPKVVTKSQPKPKVLSIKKSEGVRYVVVEKGDTFYNISKRSGVSITKIRQYNSSFNDSLAIGQKVYLDFPKPIKKKLTKPQSTKPTPISKPKIYTYKVKAGDTLYSIARRYKVSVNDLKKLNGLSNGKVIRVGQNLKIVQ